MPFCLKIVAADQAKKTKIQGEVKNDREHPGKSYVDQPIDRAKKEEYTGKIRKKESLDGFLIFDNKE